VSKARSQEEVSSAVAREEKAKEPEFVEQDGSLGKFLRIDFPRGGFLGLSSG